MFLADHGCGTLHSPTLKNKYTRRKGTILVICLLTPQKGTNSETSMSKLQLDLLTFTHRHTSNDKISFILAGTNLVREVLFKQFQQ